MKKNKKRVYDILLGLCIVVFLVSGGMLVQKFAAQKKNDSRLEELSDLLEEQVETAAPTENLQAADSESVPVQVEEVIEDQRAARVKAYSKVREQNPDMVGWVRIEGTKIDYPVLQSLSRPNFYLKHDFDQNSSIYGAPYVAEECDLAADCKNILIYGHHMKNGSMFAALDGYLDKAFWEEHPIIEFDTMEEYGNYQVMGVFTISALDSENPLYSWLACGNEEAFGHFVSYVKEHSVYDTKTEAEWGDHLISLITCEYTHKDGRLIVVAKKTEEASKQQ